MVQPLTHTSASANTIRRSTPTAVQIFRFLVRHSLRTIRSAMGDYKLFAAAIVVALVGVGIVIGRGSMAQPMPQSTVTPLTVRVTVAPGDSLWSLARRYGNPDTYIEDNVEAMAKTNGMAAKSRLVVGQRLLVTVSNPVELASLQTHVADAR